MFCSNKNNSDIIFQMRVRFKFDAKFKKKTVVCVHFLPTIKIHVIEWGGF